MPWRATAPTRRSRERDEPRTHRPAPIDRQLEHRADGTAATLGWAAGIENPNAADLVHVWGVRVAVHDRRAGGERADQPVLPARGISGRVCHSDGGAADTDNVKS